MAVLLTGSKAERDLPVFFFFFWRKKDLQQPFSIIVSNKQNKRRFTHLCKSTLLSFDASISLFPTLDFFILWTLSLYLYHHIFFFFSPSPSISLYLQFSFLHLLLFLGVCFFSGLHVVFFFPLLWHFVLVSSLDNEREHARPHPFKWKWLCTCVLSLVAIEIAGQSVSSSTHFLFVCLLSFFIFYPISHVGGRLLFVHREGDLCHEERDGRILKDLVCDSPSQFLLYGFFLVLFCSFFFSFS